MPTYLSPGVYVEEVPSGAPPIQGVSTSTLGMVGQTERGPAIGAQLLTSWADYERIYGGLLDLGTTYFPLAVRGFFDNGGQLLYCARVCGQAATPASQDVATGGGAAPAPAPAGGGGGGGGGGAPAPAAASQLAIEASGAGTWGNNIWVRVEAGSNPNATNAFRVTLLYYKTAPANFVDPLDPANLSNKDRVEPDLVEDFDNLVFDPTEPNDVRSTINGTSALVTVDWTGAPAQPDPLAWTQLSGGADAAPKGSDYVGNSAAPSNQRTGLAALEGIEDIALLAVPDQTHPALSAADRGQVATELTSQCERLRSRFAIFAISHDQAPNIQNIITNLPASSSFTASYYPDIQIYDDLTGLGAYITPVGHVAGIYARTDDDLGVEHAPANAEILGMLTVNTSPTQGPLQYPVTKGDQDVLNPAGVNAVRDFRSSQLGVRVWGARTMTPDPTWRYVNVRRVFIYLEQSILRGTQWVVFENNVESTWARVVRSVSNFLESFWRDGGLAGTTTQEAFFVRCDRTTMTQGDIDNGRLICLVGVAAIKPAEFVIFRFSQLTIQATS